MTTPYIKVCCGNKCSERGAAHLLETIEDAFGVGSAEMVECLDYCERAPNIEAEGRIYHECRNKNIVELIKDHKGIKIKKLTIDDLHLDDDLL